MGTLVPPEAMPSLSPTCPARVSGRRGESAQTHHYDKVGAGGVRERKASGVVRELLLEDLSLFGVRGAGAIGNDEGGVRRFPCAICDLKRERAALGGWSGDVEGVPCHKGGEGQNRESRQGHGWRRR